MGNLAVEVLKEVPAQVCRYMEMKNYKPKKINADMTKINKGIEKQKELIMEKIQKKHGGQNVTANGTVGQGGTPSKNKSEEGEGAAAENISSEVPQKKPRKKKSKKKEKTTNQAGETQENIAGAV